MSWHAPRKLLLLKPKRMEGGFFGMLNGIRKIPIASLLTAGSGLGHSTLITAHTVFDDIERYPKDLELLA
jgi:hypothetical protein